MSRDACKRRRSPHALEEHLNRLGVQVERQVEATSFTSRADGVSTSLRHPDGREETLDTAWLVGCDGAHSRVRECVGIGFPGEAYEHVFAILEQACLALLDEIGG